MRVGAEAEAATSPGFFKALTRDPQDSAHGSRGQKGQLNVEEDGLLRASGGGFQAEDLGIVTAPLLDVGLLRVGAVLMIVDLLHDPEGAFLIAGGRHGRVTVLTDTVPNRESVIGQHHVPHHRAGRHQHQGDDDPHHDQQIALGTPLGGRGARVTGAAGVTRGAWRGWVAGSTRVVRRSRIPGLSRCRCAGGRVGGTGAGGTAGWLLTG